MCLQASERWDILENVNYIIPRINCVRKETDLISRGLTSYFVKSIRVITSIQKSAVWRQPISEGGRSHVAFNLVNLNDGQIGFPIPVPRRVFDWLEPCHVPVIARAAWH